MRQVVPWRLGSRVRIAVDSIVEIVAHLAARGQEPPTLPSMTQRSRFTATHAIAVGVLVFFVVATPMALRTDARLDRVKPMYGDRAQMVWLQYQNVVAAGGAVPGVASLEDPMVVANEEFSPTDGVVVEVRAEQNDAPCVRARNDEGDVTDWECIDLDSPPVDPDPEPVDPLTGQGAQHGHQAVRALDSALEQQVASSTESILRMSGAAFPRRA